MKVIDLLNKIANGDISEDTLIEFDNGYKDYCSIRVFFDRYIMDRENLNTKIEIIEEDKKIEKITLLGEEIKLGSLSNWLKDKTINEEKIASCIEANAIKINEIIDYLEENK